MRRVEGVLLTGVYGSGKSSVAEEIAYLLEQRGEPYALLDLDYLGRRVPAPVTARPKPD
jgi:adenylylsulfate kinase-like enzyme